MIKKIVFIILLKEYKDKKCELKLNEKKMKKTSLFNYLFII